MSKKLKNKRNHLIKKKKKDNNNSRNKMDVYEPNQQIYLKTKFTIC